MPEVLLSATGVCYAYNAEPAVSEVSLEVRAGELVVLVGRNGAGKSTLLRCLAGWLHPLPGEVRMLGLPLATAERALRQKVILVPDTPTFYDELTAWEHLRFYAQAHRLDGWEMRAGRLLHRFGLWSARRSYPFTYSRGMRYKLALSLALLVEPQLLLLDEPLGPLDPVSTASLWEELGRGRSHGMGVLLSSHQLPEVEPDRFLVMEEGRLIAGGTPRELATSLSIDGTLSLGELLQAAIGGQSDALDDA